MNPVNLNKIIKSISVIFIIMEIYLLSGIIIYKDKLIISIFINIINNFKSL